MTITFPRITIAFGMLDEQFARFNIIRVFIGPPNPIINHDMIQFTYKYTFGLSISFALYARLRGHNERD